MTSGRDRTGPGDGLGERLRELEAASDANERELIDRMYANLKGRCTQSDSTVAGFFRSRSTIVRRAIVLAVFAILAIIGWFNFPLVDESVRTGPWVAMLAVFCLLLLVAMMMVTRPVHLPALPRWQVAGLVGVAVGATVLAAFWPTAGAQTITHEHSNRMVAGACMGFGLLLGVPVYALLRLVDRGNAFGNVIAAAAAGLGGNLVLKAHCAIETTGHVLLGHASVAILFVVGLGLVHRWIPSK